MILKHFKEDVIKCIRNKGNVAFNCVNGIPFDSIQFLHDLEHFKELDDSIKEIIREIEELFDKHPSRRLPGFEFKFFTYSLDYRRECLKVIENEENYFQGYFDLLQSNQNERANRLSFDQKEKELMDNFSSVNKDRCNTIEHLNDVMRTSPFGLSRMPKK